MSWPETVELTLDGIAQGGEGVGRWQNRVVFARGGLPGERVVVRLYEQREAYARGEVIELLAASPERVEPQDSDADQMPWQHIAYEAQLRFKRKILVDQLEKIGGLTDVSVAETMPASRPWGYRNSARFHVEQGEVGYHIAGTRDLRPVERDPLLLPALNQALAALRSVIRQDDALREVTLRASETHGYVVAALRSRGDVQGLAHRWMARLPLLAGVALAEGDLGNVELTEELDDVTFLLRPESFFQVNLQAAQVLLRLVREGLGLTRETRLLDLYCGVGTFALPLARRAAQVIGIEEFSGAVRDAETTAEANGITNVEFYVGPVERVLADAEGSGGALVLDPPRRGCHPRALDEIIRLAPERIVYVSCHPGTLARDLKLLTAGGFRVKSVTPVDLFPQTPHVESVSVIEKITNEEG